MEAKTAMQVLSETFNLNEHRTADMPYNQSLVAVVDAMEKYASQFHTHQQMHSFAQQEVEKHVERVISEIGLSSGSIEAIRNTPIQITK